MAIDLRGYQEDAINQLRVKANTLLGLTGNKTIVFQSPTGSGKTIMMAEFLKVLVDNRVDTKSFSFIWTAPRKLHVQSKGKLSDYYQNKSSLRCVDFEDLVDTLIGENEILFLNWESINQVDNIYIRDNERNFNLSNMIINTRNAGHKIILVIDESHHSAQTETSRDLINMFHPDLTVEVSATPTIAGDERVTVHREHVIAEEMIKKRVAINPGFRNDIASQTGDEITIESQAGESANEFILRMAIDKRVELATKLQLESSNVNPLLLIQLPDRTQGSEDIKDEIIDILDGEHDISVSNGKLAIYLSEDKENLANISRKDSEIEVMLFKTAIALGWDCPRASILCLFRTWCDFTFSTQTLGRILRMPEIRHYEDDELNTAFVFTNLSTFMIEDEVAGDFLTIQHAKRGEIYRPISLKSVHGKRLRESTRLSPEFIRDFLDAADEYDLKDKIDTDYNESRMELIADRVVEDIDADVHSSGGSSDNSDPEHTIQRVRTPLEVQRVFDLFVRDNLSPFAPESRSVGRVKDAFYRFFKGGYSAEFPHNGKHAQIIVLLPHNRHHFIDTLNFAKEKYQARVSQCEYSFTVVDDWEVPSSCNYNHRYHSILMEKSIFEPYYMAEGASQIEKDFAIFLDSRCANVRWWFKNGARDGTFFAVPFQSDSGKSSFYVDWIVVYENGDIGLYDTKSGITAETARSRAKGLADYIQEQKALDKKLSGGIVIFVNGSFWLNERAEYSYDSTDLTGSGWALFS